MVFGQVGLLSYLVHRKLYGYCEHFVAIHDHVREVLRDMQAIESAFGNHQVVCSQTYFAYLVRVNRDQPAVHFFDRI